MKSLQKKLWVLVVVSLFIFIPRYSAKAILTAFGGYNVFSVPCVCSAGTIWYTWYWPLVPWDPVAGGALALGTPATSIEYSWWDPQVPTTWTLGEFIPGGELCWQPAVPTGCILWPTLGFVWMDGSSPPGSV